MMMNERSTEDLISAYYDGELTPAERETVERLLETSAEARQTLDVYRALSGLMHELPQQRAPAEFADAVMRAAERRTLFPVAPGSAAALVARSASPRRRWNRRTLWVTAVTTSAAAMLLFMVKFTAKQPPERSASEAPNPAIVMGWQQPGKRSAHPLANPDDSAEWSFPAQQDHDFEESEHLTAAGPSTGAVAVSMALNKEITNGTLSRDGSVRQTLVLKNPQQKIEVGKFVEALDTSGGKVAVVNMLVVDIQKGLNSLQVLLARNHIPEQSDADKSAVGGKDRTAKGANETSSNLVAIWVEAKNEQLSAVLEGLAQKDEILALQDDGSIDIAQLNQAAPVRTQSAAKQENLVTAANVSINRVLSSSELETLTVQIKNSNQFQNSNLVANFESTRSAQYDMPVRNKTPIPNDTLDLRASPALAAAATKKEIPAPTQVAKPSDAKSSDAAQRKVLFVIQKGTP